MNDLKDQILDEQAAVEGEMERRGWKRDTCDSIRYYASSVKHH
jgi:hypothetical protein